MKNWQAAKEDATTCIAKDPSFIKGYYRLSVAHTELGDYDDAANVLKEAIRRDPGMFGSYDSYQDSHHLIL